MPDEGRVTTGTRSSRRFSGPTRTALQIGLVATFAGVLAIPPIAVGTSGTASVDPLWTALRVAALEAFTLIFVNIVTGAFRPVFTRIFRAPAIHRFHVATGISGFVLAVAHGSMVAAFGVAGYSAALWVGPAVLVALTVVIVTALGRRRWRRQWRWIHRLNYVIFAAILVHGFALGYDLGDGVFLKAWFVVCAVVAAAGLAYRVVGLLRRDDQPRMTQA